MKRLTFPLLSELALYLICRRRVLVTFASMVATSSSSLPFSNSPTRPRVHSAQSSPSFLRAGASPGLDLGKPEVVVTADTQVSHKVSYM